jgi:hypothetical protein
VTSHLGWRSICGVPLPWDRRRGIVSGSEDLEMNGGFRDGQITFARVARS